MKINFNGLCKRESSEGNLFLSRMSLPTATYAAASKPYFAPLNGAGGITVSSINISGGIIADVFSPGNSFQIFNVGGVQGYFNTTVSTISNVVSQSVTNSSGVELSALDTVVNDGSASINFSQNTTIQKASIDFNNDVGGGNGGVSLKGENNEQLTVGNGKVEVTGADFVCSTINGVQIPNLAYLIYNLTPGVTFASNGGTPVVVAVKTPSVAGKSYRVTCVYDVTTTGGTTVAGDYSELQITGTGVAVLSMETTTFNELVTPLITPGQSKTSVAIFEDADGGGFNLEIVANSATANFTYTFYSVVVEQLN